MKNKDLVSKTEDELSRLLEEKRKKIEELKFAMSSGTTKKTKELREEKKDVARIMTIINKK